MGADGDPGPPECGVTSPARRRRTTETGFPAAARKTLPVLRQRLSRGAPSSERLAKTPRPSQAREYKHRCLFRSSGIWGGRRILEGWVMATSERRTFAVVLEPEEEGGFTVRVPTFPEIVTYGKDETEALAMAKDAIRLVVTDSVARGEPVPGGEPPRIREVTVTLAA